MVAITAAEEIPLATEARVQLAPPPRSPPTALGAGTIPPFPPRREPRPLPPRRLHIVVYLIRRPSLFRALATSVILGAFAALTRLGPHPFSLRGILPVLAGGSVFGLVVAAARRLIPHPSRTFGYVLLTLAGAAGGMTWWMLVQSSGSLLVAMGLGALLTQAVVAFELWLGQAAA
jgi:hypothetical protein